jgi:hypothetical protein
MNFSSLRRSGQAADMGAETKTSDSVLQRGSIRQGKSENTGALSDKRSNLSRRNAGPENYLLMA